MRTVRYTPGAHYFVSVCDLDPAGKDRCIYFTQKQAAGYPRCSLHCRRDDQDQARVLLGRLDTTQAEAPDLETVKALVLLCCCTNAKHRTAIEKDELLLPLAERWLVEIRERRRARGTTSDNDKALRPPSPPPQQQATGLASPPPTPPPRPADGSALLKRLDPEVSDFVAFAELDPLHDKRCIYKKQNGQDCPYECADEDNVRARKLHRDIVSRTTGPTDLGLLQALALYSCCGPSPGGARHQNRIEYKGLLRRLAERWLGEITQQQAAGLHLQASDTGSSLTTAIKTTTSTTESTLRSGKPIRPFSSGQPWKLSHFRRHVDEPRETVASKMRQPLSGADAGTGRLYIFTRASSRGYVKIGFTSGAVQDRLDQWARCGYTPELVYSTDVMANVRRAETLVHYELARRWRAERGCHACGASHKEWFRIAAEQAVQVVRGWEQIMRHAGLYSDGSRGGIRGSMTGGWARIVDGMAEQGICVTAARLLEVHQWLQTVGGCMPDSEKRLHRRRRVVTYNPPASTCDGG